MVVSKFTIRCMRLNGLSTQSVHLPSPHTPEVLYKNVLYYFILIVRYIFSIECYKKAVCRFEHGHQKSFTKKFSVLTLVFRSHFIFIIIFPIFFFFRCIVADVLQNLRNWQKYARWSHDHQICECCSFSFAVYGWQVEIYIF